MSLDLIVMEEKACREESQMAQWVCQLINRVRDLEHILADPSYHFAGGRIRRQAIVTRNAQIDLLRDEVKEKDARIEALEKELEETLGHAIGEV